MGPVTTQFARLDPGPSQSYGVVGAAIAVVGAVLLVLSFTVLDWYSFSGSKFSDLHRGVHDLGSLATGPARLYFGWLAWVMAIVAVLAALIAAAPVVGGPLRVVAPIVAAAGVVVSLFAVQFARSGLDPVNGYDGYGSFLRHARLGFWFAVAGFVLVGFGALLGPRNRTD
jgi:hypothetical protein